MANLLFDALAGIEKGISEGDENIGTYLKAKADSEEKLSKLLEEVEKKRRREAERKIRLLKEEERQLGKKEGKFEKNIPLINKEIRKRKKEIQDEIERYAIDEQNRLLGLSEALAETKREETSPIIEKKPPREGKPKKAIRPKGPEEAHLSDLEYEQGQKLLQWMSVGKASDALKSIPSAFLETGEGLSGLLGAKDLKEKIRNLKKSYEEKIGIDDRDAMYAQAGRLGGDLINPLGIIGRGFKLGKFASKIPKLAKHLGAGSLYGAIQAEKDDADPLVGAAMGAGTAAVLQGAGKVLSKGKKAKFQKIKDRATFTKEDEIAQRAAMMGEKATIPEIVGDEVLINKMKKDSSNFNKKRLSSIEGNIKKNAKSQIDALPKGEEELMQLYANTGDLQRNVSENSSKLYDVVKESGIGSEGLLEKSVLKEWIQAMKRAEPNIKGLPKMKVNGGKIKEVEKLLMFAPDDPKSYRNFYIQNSDILPTAGDFLKYKSKVGNMIEKANSSQIEGLSNLSEDLNRIIKRVDKNSSIAKANRDYAVKAAPLKQKEIKKAVKATTFTESQEGRPKISKVFGEQSIENNLAFKQLPTEDKKRVIGAFLNEALREEKHPVRAMVETWKKLPDYIKLSSDPEIQKILRGMRDLANVNKTLSSMQRTTTSDIGSRQSVAQATKIARLIGYGGTLLTNPSMTAGLALAEGGTKAALAGKHALLRKSVSQKQLKHYLRPELLDEIYRKKMGRLQMPAIKIGEEYKNYKEGERK